jgi:uncharacterized protein GlcG (DUF336 family)
MSTMLIPFKFVTAISFACAITPPANAELLNEKSLSTAVALTIAQTAYDSCVQQGYHVSVHVVGREGQVLVAIRGDGSSPHTLENSLRKAYTARTFRTSSGDFAQRVKDNPTLGVVHLPGVIALQGLYPSRSAKTSSVRSAFPVLLAVRADAAGVEMVEVRRRTIEAVHCQQKLISICNTVSG